MKSLKYHLLNFVFPIKTVKFPKITKKGIFLDSPLSLVDKFINEKEVKKVINLLDSNYILDAGHGDGRIVFLFSIYHNKILGIEDNKELYSKSIRNSKSKIISKISKDKIKLIKGDYLDDKLYEDSNIDFKKIKLFYNYIDGDNITKLEQKILEKSEKDTYLITLHHGKKEFIKNLDKIFEKIYYEIDRFSLYKKL